MRIAAFELLIFLMLGTVFYLSRRRGEGLGLPLVGAFVFAFLYVVQPVGLWLDGTLEVFLTPWQVTKGILLPALMFLCFLAGWSQGRRKSVVASQPPSWNPERLFRFGFWTALVGLILKGVFILRSGGLLVYYGKPHLAGAAWTENTAYLYSSSWWILSGTALMILAASRFKLGRLERAPIVLFMGVMFADAVLGSSRGTFFATGSCLLVSVCLARRRQPSVTKALFALVLAGLGVVLLLGYRVVLYLGEQTAPVPRLSQALAGPLSIDETHAKLQMTGVEFVYHALAIDTVDKTQKYHLGINWIYVVTVHIIPRILWPDKPYGFETPGITWADIEEQTGIRITAGAAPGIVADIYAQFGLFSVVFFFIFGNLAGRLYEHATGLQSPLVACAYVMLHALSLNTFAQGFGALIVAFLFSLIPVALFTFSTRPRKSSVRHPGAFVTTSGAPLAPPQVLGRAHGD